MKRLRMKHYRDYEWKKNPNAIYVGRGKGERGKWGNPFKVSEYGLKKCLELYREWLMEKLAHDPEFLEPLRGKDLVCFCKLDQPCHADIIIEMIEIISQPPIFGEFKND